MKINSKNLKKKNLVFDQKKKKFGFRPKNKNICFKGKENKKNKIIIFDSLFFNLKKLVSHSLL
jgi:hypothetical protein